MKTLTLPEWTKRMPDDARLTQAELVEIMGYTGHSAISKRVGRGQFPAPDSYSGNIRGRTKKGQWKLSTLREFELTQG